MLSRTVPASMKYLDEVMAFLEAFLCREGCPEDDRRLIEVSVEELFTNIANYAYGPAGGSVKIDFGTENPAEAADEPETAKAPETEKAERNGNVAKTAWIRLSDQGIPYDPFSRKDPDIHLPIEERPIGGLGIYMVKQFMDSVSYEWRDGCNVTTVTKRFWAQKPREL